MTRIIYFFLMATLLTGCPSAYVDESGNYQLGNLCDPSSIDSIGIDTYYAGGACEASYAIKAANMYCDSKNRKMLLKNLQGDNIVFQCLNADDPAYTSRPGFEIPPDVTIEDKR